MWHSVHKVIVVFLSCSNFKTKEISFNQTKMSPVIIWAHSFKPTLIMMMPDAKAIPQCPLSALCFNKQSANKLIYPITIFFAWEPGLVILNKTLLDLICCKDGVLLRISSSLHIDSTVITNWLKYHME